MNTPALETEHLILRKFTEKDIEALFIILKDEEVNKFLPWYPMKSLEETKNSMKKDMFPNICSHMAMHMLYALKKTTSP